MLVSVRTTSTDRAIARQIRAQRLRAGLTRAQLAEQLDCSPAEISAIEQCKVRVSVDELVRIARALRVDPVKLLRAALD